MNLNKELSTKTNDVKYFSFSGLKKKAKIVNVLNGNTLVIVFFS